MMSSLQLTRRTFFEADLIDQQREEEERRLYQWEDQREKEGGKKGPSARSSPATQRASLNKKTKG